MSHLEILSRAKPGFLPVGSLAPRNQIRSKIPGAPIKSPTLSLRKVLPWPTLCPIYSSSVRGVSTTNFKHRALIDRCEISSGKDLLTVQFPKCQTFTFHAQWLNDAKCDDGPSRSATNAFCQRMPTASIEATRIIHQGSGSTLTVTWGDGSISDFPVIWLRTMAPLVAKASVVEDPPMAKGWLAQSLNIPHVAYVDLISESFEQSTETVMRILDELLDQSNTGIIKVVGLPAPDLASEREKKNTLVTKVLKQIFGSVFVHPRRGADQTFNVASHHKEDVKRAIGLPNYNTNEVLLPHVDHAHYENPIQVQGWYGLEGESENTFVSSLATLRTLKEESPDLFEHLCQAPTAFGRVVHYYSPPLYQATADTVVTMYPGTQQVKRVRWHPHLSGSLMTPFDRYDISRQAHQKFQEIMRRETHQLKVCLQPGDLYIWNNFTILHGRERVLKVPRTGVGQTVPEQVVVDKYRALKIGQLKDYIDEKWLVHVPTAQLQDLVKLTLQQLQ